MIRLIRRAWHYLCDNLAAETESYIAWLPFGFAVGITLYFALPTEPNLWLVLGLFEGWLLLFFLCRYKTAWHGVFVAGLLVLCGFINIEMHTIYKNKSVQFDAKQIIYLSGRVDDISYNEKGRPRLLLTAAQNFDEPLIGQYRVTLTGRYAPVNIGQCVEMIATLFPPSPLPVRGGYQLNRKYFYEGLSALGYADSEAFVIPCPAAKKSSFYSRLNAVRQKIGADVAKVLPAATAGVANAVLLGDKSRIPEQITRNYRAAGLAHFLAVSGLHMGAIAGLVFFLVRWLLTLLPFLVLRYDAKKIAAAVAIIFSIGYLLLSGMAIPAQRAFIMTTVVLIGVMFNRRAISLRMVSVAALVILILMPQALISISFQMSFAAVYALVAFYEAYAGKLRYILSFGGKIFAYLAGIVVGDLVASLATAPFALYHFHQLAIYTSLGNLLAGPLIGLYIMPLVLVVLFSLPFGLNVYALQGLGGGLNILNLITAKVAALPHSLWYSDALPFWGFIAIVVGGFWLCVWQRPWRRLGIVPIVIGLLPLLRPVAPDMAVAPHGEGIAVRNAAGEMVLLPHKIDGWTKSVWAENLHIVELPRAENKALSAALRGEGKMPDNLPLQCSAAGCIYGGQVVFTPQGKISTVSGEMVDNGRGLYIYCKPELKMVPLYEECGRLWQQVRQKSK